MEVLIQLRAAAREAAATGEHPVQPVTAGYRGAGVATALAYAPVQIPAVTTTTGAPVHSLSQPLRFSFDPEISTYLVPGEVPDGEDRAAALKRLRSDSDVVGVFSNPIIEPFALCLGDPAVGDESMVAKLLATEVLHAHGMDGEGVPVAVVDTGINAAYLRRKGRRTKVDTMTSWTPQGVYASPGEHEPGHGTMCAYDVGIAAPHSTLLDIAVLARPDVGFRVRLQDAVKAYEQLGILLRAQPKERRALVITNSWGMYSRDWDLPVDDPGNYSDNSDHPFSLLVASLETEGADILFAAGNCGRDCPKDTCEWRGTPPLCGANSHPRVISVAGVNVRKERVGYSTQGPGRLHAKKPDVAAYTHFAGSGILSDEEGGDNGTSASCPVAAGVVAAIRSRYPHPLVTASELRSLIQRTAEDRGGLGHDADYGFGVLDVKALVSALLLSPPRS